MRTFSKRLVSLDVFRGMTIAGMILVNTIIESPFATLAHAEWNGCHFADLIFPFFLFVVGISLVLSMSKQVKNHVSESEIVYKIIKRTLVILLLGYILNFFPNHLTWDTLATVRVYGVLQRIALCYFFAALCYLYMNSVAQVGLIIVLLLGYWFLLMHVPVPHFGVGDLSPSGNLGAYLDRLLFSPANLYGKTYDPEGLLGTLPALATTLIGSITGMGLLSRKTQKQKCAAMLVAGIMCMILGWIWGQWFPINKPLWTSSFVLWTAGMGLCIYAVCYAVIEMKHWIRWSKPFEIFGLNAVALYFLHVFFFKIQIIVHLPCGNGQNCNLWQYIIKNGFAWAPVPYSYLYYALASVLIWLLVATIMYRKKIFIKV